MPAPSFLTVLYQHHLWANLRLLEACAGLSDEQLDTTVAGTFGSIRDTLQHLVLAEQGYFSRISTGRRLQRPEGAPPPTMAQLADSLRQTGAGLIDWASRVQGDDAVEIDWDGELRSVPKTILLTQAINHATEHRSQVMTILTQLGVQPPDCDAWTYYEATGR